VVKALAGLKSLHTLNLEGTNVADGGLKDLSGLKRLRSLNLDSTKVTDAGLKELAGLTELRWLNLTASKATEKGAEGLRKALPRARIVRSPWEKKAYTNARGQKMPYRLLLPEGHDPKKAYPLIVFLDGIGSRGTDNEKQVSGASLLVTKKNRQKHPCFVVAPQCPGGKDFPFWNQGVHSGLVMGVIEDVEKSHRIDPRRIYATGLSDGGFGVWFLIHLYPDRFAAAVPIAGQGLGPKAAPKLTHVPIWSFHGEKDNPRPVREMMAALEKAGGKPKYTEYKNAGHHIWGRAYNEPELFEWLFAQKRK
jgi:predicted peptidase